MKGRDYTITVALCVSLVAHGALSWILLARYTEELGSMIHQPGFANYRWEHEGILIRRELAGRPNSVFGEPEGKGIALNSTPGARTMKAREAPEDQGFLSKDPVGPGRVGNPPSYSLVEPGEGGDGRVGVGGASAAVQQVAKARRNIIAVEGNAKSAKPQAAAMAAIPNSVMQSAAIGARGGRPGPSVPAADPAPMGDSEIDPFSKIGSADVRAGKIDARFGRKVKTTRPRLSMAGKYDLATLQFPSVVFRVKADETGKVVSVETIKSSGSNDIDQPCRVAMYDWWIEPPKDKNGKPVACVMEWRINWIN